MSNEKEVDTMSPLTEVPAQSIGGFDVQYTDDATGQADALSDDLRNRLHQHMQMVAAVNPYVHGSASQEYGVNDRRVLHFEALIVTFWLSSPVKVLTVVDIQDGGDRDETPPFGTPITPAAQRAESLFISFGPDDEDDEDEDASEILSAGITTTAG